MIIPDRVIDLETQKTYEIDREHGDLGKGGIGIVYPVKGAERDAIVVKIAFSDLSAATLADFVTEQKISLELWELTKHTPWAHKAEVPRQKDCKVILLERIKKDQYLVDMAKPPSESPLGSRLPEDIVLQVGAQYAELLEALHGKLERTTRGDRKAGDLYWDNSQKRLIVLDWNRALPMPKNAQERALLIRQDLRIFGQLWAQLAMGPNAETTFVDPFDDTNPAWYRLSVGTRVLIFKALNSHTAQGFQDATAFKNAATKQWQDFQHAQSQAKELFADALNLRKDADKESSLSRRAELASRVRVLADLVRRQTTRLPDKQAKELSELETWAKESEQKDIEQLRAITRQLFQRIQNGSFKEAATLALTETRRIDNIGDAEKLALMALRRWSYLANWAWQGNQNDLVIGETARIIANALDTFEQKVGLARHLTPQEARTQHKAIADLSAAIQDAQRTLAVSNGLRELPESVTREIRPLELELQIREHWIADRPADALAQLEKLEKGALDQATALRQVVLSPLGFDGYVDQREQEAYIKTHTAEFKRQTDAIFDLIARSDQWLNLSSRFDEAIQYYRTNLKGRQGVAQEQAQDDELLKALQGLDRHFAGTLESRDEASALKEFGSLVFPALRAELKDKIHRHITVSALAHLECLAEGEWLDELEAGRQLFTAIQRFGESAERKKNQERLDKVETRFAEWRQTYEELSQSGAERIITDPAPEYDKILQQAERARVQFFDRRALAPDHIDQHRVAVIRSVREARRMEQQISELASQMRGLADNLVAHRIELEKRLKLLEQTYGSAAKNLATAQKGLETDHHKRQQALVAAKEALEKELDGYRVEMEDFHTLLIQAEKLSPRLEAAETYIERVKLINSELTRIQSTEIPNLDSKLDQLHKLTAETEKAIRDTRDYLDKLEEPRVQEARTASAQAILARSQILLANYIAAGLSAAREFDFDKANTYFSYIKQDLPEAPPDSLNHLRETVEWLKKRRSETGSLDVLRIWKKALENWQTQSADQPGERIAAEQARADWKSAISLVSSKDRNFWLIAELEERHLFLQQAMERRQVEGTASSLEKRREFVKEANQIFILLRSEFSRVTQEPGDSLPSFDVLNKKVWDLINALGKIVETRLDAKELDALDQEIVSSWAKRQDEASSIWTQFCQLWGQEGIGAKGKSRRNSKQTIVQALPILTGFVDTASSEVFYVFFPVWAEEFRRIASPGDQDWLDFGKAKSELGMKLLNHPLSH